MAHGVYLPLAGLLGGLDLGLSLTANRGAIYRMQRTFPTVNHSLSTEAGAGSLYLPLLPDTNYL